MRYFVELKPRYELGMQLMSSVTARPPSPAYLIGRSVLADCLLYHLDEGITYGGDDIPHVPRPHIALKGELRQRGDGFDEGHGGSSGVQLSKGAPVQLEAHGDGTSGVRSKTASCDR